MNEINDIWTDADFKKGWCSQNQVGKPIDTPTRNVDINQAPEEVKTVLTPLSDEERKMMLRTAQDEILRLFHANPAAFVADNPSNANKILDLALKAQERGGDDPEPVFDENTIKRMSTSDLKRYLIRNMSESLTAEIKAEFGGK